MKKNTFTQIEIDTYKELLTERGRPDIYFVIRKIAPSGMSRVFSFYYFSEDGGCHNLDTLISQLTCHSYDHRMRGVRVHGVGMDMASHVLSNLMNELFGTERSEYFNHYQL